MKPDISTPADIRTLIDNFYEKVQSDEVIGFIFNDIAHVDWPRHLPVMYSFWEFLLLGTPDAYRGNPIQKHLDLHKKIPLKIEHFDRWLSLFQGTVDDFFEGPSAENAKFRAYAISETWKPKFDGPFAVGVQKVQPN
ncbi:MAG: group III truncated hemoglobin [Saprospiraceae bacterium]|nr:group III truncated hemoglobin [Saprospiraceae bacterium]